MEFDDEEYGRVWVRHTPTQFCDIHDEFECTIDELERVQVVHFTDTQFPPHIRIVRPSGRYICFLAETWDELDPQQHMALLRQLNEYTKLYYENVGNYEEGMV
jgi:hypothetical protein